MSLVTKILFTLVVIASFALGIFSAVLYVKTAAALTLPVLASAMALGVGVMVVSACFSIGLFFVLAVTYFTAIER